LFFETLAKLFWVRAKEVWSLQLGKLTEGRADMENRGISSRAKKLKDKYLATPPGVCSERAKIVTQAYQDYESLPAILRRAKVLKRVLEEMSIWIANDELIVGNQAKVARYAPIFPEFSFEWILAEMDEEPFELRDADRFLIDEETKSDLRKIGPYWKGKTVNDLIIGRLPEETAASIANSAVYTFAPSVVNYSGVGHYSPSYKKVITKGFNGIRQDALEKLKVMGIPADGNEVDTYNFLKAVIISCDAAVSFAQRYADLAKQMAVEESDSARKTELLKIASICEKVPANPATTFHEACQAFWFFQLILQLESSGHSISPGRFDQYMYPYYSKDLLTGQLAREDAQELVECLWIKLSEINKIRPIGATRTAGGYPMFQNLIVGGQDRDGKDATNDLSFICLDASQNVGLPQPSISARLWNGTPEVLWNKIVEVTKKGLGMPALYNDEVIIPEKLHDYIGFVAPYLFLYDEFTAEENLFHFSNIRGIKYDKERADFLFRKLNLFDRKDDIVRGYSSGMKQRLKFIFALLHNPRCIILDEPTSNLDNDGKDRVYELIREEAKSNLVIIASNEEADLKLCKEIINIENYKLNKT